MNLNEIYNSAFMWWLLSLLATEGIKCTSGVFNYPIKGPKAFWLFIGVFVLVSCFFTGQPSDRWYFVHSAARLFSAIGVYSFISRLYKAIEKK